MPLPARAECWHCGSYQWLDTKQLHVEVPPEIGPFGEVLQSEPQGCLYIISRGSRPAIIVLPSSPSSVSANVDCAAETNPAPVEIRKPEQEQSGSKLSEIDEFDLPY
jgi:hypothetical protein